MNWGHNLKFWGMSAALITAALLVAPAVAQEKAAPKTNLQSKVEPGGDGKDDEKKGSINPKTVKILMGEALTLIPSETKKSDGTVIKFDKSDMSKITVPFEDAERIIKVAYMSAQASRCGMPEVEAENWQLLRNTEIAKKQWNDQQLFYINRLHMLVVMMVNGNYKLKEGADADTKPVGEKTIPRELVTPKPVQCSDEDKQQIRGRIEAYWNGPKKS